MLPPTEINTHRQLHSKDNKDNEVLASHKRAFKSSIFDNRSPEKGIENFESFKLDCDLAFKTNSNKNVNEKARDILN